MQLPPSQRRAKREMVTPGRDAKTSVRHSGEGRLGSLADVGSPCVIQDGGVQGPAVTVARTVACRIAAES